jgi:hypothetical protein
VTGKVFRFRLVYPGRQPAFSGPAACRSVTAQKATAEAERLASFLSTNLADSELNSFCLEARVGHSELI